MFFYIQKWEICNSFSGIFLQIYSQLCHVKTAQTFVMLNNTQAHNDMWQYCLDRIKAQTSAEEFREVVPSPSYRSSSTVRRSVCAYPTRAMCGRSRNELHPVPRPIISQLYGQQTKLHLCRTRARWLQRLLLRLQRPTRRRSPVSTPRRTPQI